ncbi:MAG TPA: hypothetical protein VGD98_06125 [Ktedonobacteraceae bacterium]
MHTAEDSALAWTIKVQIVISSTESHRATMAIQFFVGMIIRGAMRF